MVTFYRRLIMAKKLYVGNLSHEIDDNELRDLFAPHGSIFSAKVILDRETNRSRGFGFVEMSSEDEVQAAIDALNNQEVHGRPLTVNVARSKESRGGGFRGGGGSGFRGLVWRWRRPWPCCCWWRSSAVSSGAARSDSRNSRPRLARRC